MASLYFSTLPSSLLFSASTILLTQEFLKEPTRRTDRPSLPTSVSAGKMAGVVCGAGNSEVSQVAEVGLEQYFSTFLASQPFSSVPPVVTLNHKLIFVAPS